MDTPVPIPNTEVTHRRGEGIRKDRIASCRAFFLLFYIILIKIYQYKIIKCILTIDIRKVVIL